MRDFVHILNGDSTQYGLKESGLLGESVIWREMLVEGPLEVNVDSESFWKKRASFFENELAISRASYSKKVIDEISKIPNLNTKEYVLWFEYDLFCQINLLALCTFLLNNFNEKIRYSLICVGKVPGYSGLTPLGHIQPKDYPSLFDNRIKLDKQDLITAKKYWELFVNGDIEALIQTIKNPVFEYLKMAIQQYQKLSPNASGLNEIDLQLLSCLKEKEKTERQIIGELLKWQAKNTVYGFGDLQYKSALQKLSPYYKIEKERYYMNKKGLAKIDES